MRLITRIRIADAATLIRIRDVDLKHPLGLTAAERGLVWEEIARREAQLDYAVAAPSHPSSFSRDTRFHGH